MYMSKPYIYTTGGFFRQLWQADRIREICASEGLRIVPFMGRMAGRGIRVRYRYSAPFSVTGGLGIEIYGEGEKFRRLEAELCSYAESTRMQL